MMDDDQIQRGALPPSLARQVEAWARAQACLRCGARIGDTGVAVTVLISARAPAPRVIALRPVAPAPQCADQRSPYALAVCAQCAATVADDAGIPTTADAIRAGMGAGRE